MLGIDKEEKCVKMENEPKVQEDENTIQTLNEEEGVLIKNIKLLQTNISNNIIRDVLNNLIQYFSSMSFPSMDDLVMLSKYVLFSGFLTYRRTIKNAKASTLIRQLLFTLSKFALPSSSSFSYVSQSVSIKRNDILQVICRTIILGLQKLPSYDTEIVSCFIERYLDFLLVFNCNKGKYRVENLLIDEPETLHALKVSINAAESIDRRITSENISSRAEKAAKKRIRKKLFRLMNQSATCFSVISDKIKSNTLEETLMNESVATILINVAVFSVVKVHKAIENNIKLNETYLNEIRELKDRLLKFYVKHSIESRKGFSAKLQLAFIPFFATINNQEFKDSLFNVSCRMLRRQRENTLVLLNELVSSLSIDYSEYAEELLVKNVLDDMANSSEKVKTLSVLLFKNIAKKTSNHCVIFQICKNIYHSLASGVINKIPTRVAYLNLFYSLTLARGFYKEKKELKEYLCGNSYFFKCIKSDNNEDIKINSIKIIGRITSLIGICNDNIEAESYKNEIKSSLTILLDIFNDKKASEKIQEAVLCSVGKIIEHAREFSKDWNMDIFLLFVEPLIRIIEVAAYKNTSRLMSLRGWVCLLKLSLIESVVHSINITIEKKLTTKHLHFLYDPFSYINNLELNLKASEEEMKVQCEIYCLLCSSNLSFLKRNLTSLHKNRAEGDTSGISDFSSDGFIFPGSLESVYHSKSNCAEEKKFSSAAQMMVSCASSGFCGKEKCFLSENVSFFTGFHIGLINLIISFYSSTSARTLRSSPRAFNCASDKFRFSSDSLKAPLHPSRGFEEFPGSLPPSSNLQSDLQSDLQLLFSSLKEMQNMCIHLTFAFYAYLVESSLLHSASAQHEDSPQSNSSKQLVSFRENHKIEAAYFDSPLCIAQWSAGAPNSQRTESNPRPNAKFPPTTPYALRKCLAYIKKLMDAQLDQKSAHLYTLLLTLCFFHPSLNSGRSTTSVKKLKTMNCKGLMHIDEPYVTDIILKCSKLSYYDSTGFRLAALKLVRFFFHKKTHLRYFSSINFENFKYLDKHIIEHLIESLHTRKLSEEHEFNVKMYFSCEGVLFEDDNVYKAEEVVSKNLKKDKYAAKLYGNVVNEIDTSLNNMSLSANKTPSTSHNQNIFHSKKDKDLKSGVDGKCDKNVTREDIEKQKIQSQTKLRRVIKQRVDECTYSLWCLGCMSNFDSCGDVYNRFFEEIVENLKCLLKSPLVCVYALNTLKLVVNSCLSKSVLSKRALLPYAYLQIYLRTEEDENKAEKYDCLGEESKPISTCAHIPSIKSKPKAHFVNKELEESILANMQHFERHVKKKCEKNYVCLEILNSLTKNASLSSNACFLIFPVISFTLEMHKEIPAEAQGVAMNALSQLLKHKSKLNTSLVLDSISKCLSLYPGILNSGGGECLKYLSFYFTNSEIIETFCSIAITDEEKVRETVVLSLSNAENNTMSDRDNRKITEKAFHILFILSTDENENTRTAAMRIIEKNRLDFSSIKVQYFIDFLNSRSKTFQYMTSLAIAKFAHMKFLKEKHDILSCVLRALIEKFKSYVKPKQEADEMKSSRSATLESAKKHKNSKTSELVNAFTGIFITFKALAKLKLFTKKDHLDLFFSFMFNDCLNEKEIRTQEELRNVLFNCGIEVIDNADISLIKDLYRILDSYGRFRENPNSNEVISTAITLYYGVVARHLDIQDPIQGDILQRLIEKLLNPRSTISVELRKEIAATISPLVKRCIALENSVFTAESLVNKMITEALNNPDLSVRIGAALGLGAVVKGLGLATLKQLNVMKTLSEGLEHQKDLLCRQGSLMCFECLSDSLGRLFEPYVIHILPLLLNAFSDSSMPVRQAAQKAANVIMKQLSGHGVKLVLPSLIEKVSDKQWRTRVGSIELLSAMSNCASRQLSSCLPEVIPVLCDCVSNSNAKVKESANEALRRIASIISNPEIKQHVPTLIKSLVDPSSESTKEALKLLLNTAFVHTVDAPSLAIICPIVIRALRERNSEIKTKAAQIVASLVILTKDSRDFSPYYPQVLPHLKTILMDPIPGVRMVAAKALGTIAGGLGEEHLGDLLPWLFNSLKSCDSSVERSGAAHGLSEVLVALGKEKLKQFFPAILSNASDPNTTSEVREGYLGLFVFLPSALESEFEEFVPSVLPVLLENFSDSHETVRNVSFRAAKALVLQYGASHTALLVKPLEEGLFNADWRIRQNSVLLLGVLLEQILKRNDNYVDENPAISEVLTLERRSFLLSSLYIVRSDENVIVRQTAITVWKNMVSNTPMTVKELLPILTKKLIFNLGSESIEKQKVAGKCVGDIVQKFGELTLSLLLPVFMQSLKSNEEHIRRGACIGLSELIHYAPKNLLVDSSTTLLHALRNTIYDSSPAVRVNATKCVSLLVNCIGEEALLATLPNLLNDVCSHTFYCLADLSDNYLAAINGIELLVSNQPSIVLPKVLSVISKPPYDIGKIRLMSSICSIPNTDKINGFLNKVLSLLVEATAHFYYYQDNLDNQCNEKSSKPVEEFNGMTDLSDETKKAFNRIIDRLDETGIDILYSTLANYLSEYAPHYDNSYHGKIKEIAAKEKSKQKTEKLLKENEKMNPYRREAIYRMYTLSFNSTQLDISSHINKIVSTLFSISLTDPYEKASEEGGLAISILIKNTKKEIFIPYISLLVNTIGKLVVDPLTGKELTENTNPKIELNGLRYCIERVFSLFQNVLMLSTNFELKETSALGIKYLILYSPNDSLKSMAVKIGGPLIRILNDKLSTSLKIAILTALEKLIICGNVSLKALMPQLQTTFLKSLFDINKTVRLQSASCIGNLMNISILRVEMLLNELSTSLSNNNTYSQNDKGVKECILFAIFEVLKKICNYEEKNIISNGVCEKLVDTMWNIIIKSKEEDEENEVKIASQCLSLLLINHSSDSFCKSFLIDKLFCKHKDYKFGSSLALSYFLRLAGSWKILKKFDLSLLAIKSIEFYLNDDCLAVKRNAIYCFSNMTKIARDNKEVSNLCFNMLEKVGNAMNFNNSILISDTLGAFKRLAKYSKEELYAKNNLSIFSSIVIPHIFSISSSVKLQAECAMKYALLLNERKHEYALNKLNLEDKIDKKKLQQLSEYVHRVLSKTSVYNNNCVVSDSD